VSDQDDFSAPEDLPDLSALSDIVGAFSVPGHLAAAVTWGTGHINDTWRVLMDDGSRRVQYVLQRLNSRVFRRPDLVMQNVARITARVNRQEGALAAGSIRIPELIPARAGALWHRDAEGGHWRLMPFISGTEVRDRVTSVREARELGRAFGEFHERLAGWDAPWLHETIPGFHDTVARYAALDQAIVEAPLALRDHARFEIAGVMAHRDLAGRITELQASGGIPERVVHNDAKIGNVLFEERSGRAAWVIDLDTVMPGTLLHDFGDLVRSSVSPSDEDERDLARVEVRVPLFEALAAGYLGAAGATLAPEELAHLVLAGRIITLEQAVRFLADYLAGDRYYRTTRSGQNLDRARTQLRLFERLSEHEPELESVIARLAGNTSK
jgi:Ser/Thr protein kinase RdoA (MazF antagonist)